MFMERNLWEEGSIVYECYFNKKKLIKVLHSLGISNWKWFIYKPQAEDTELMMREFDKRGWHYKEIACEFQKKRRHGYYVKKF